MNEGATAELKLLNAVELKFALADTDLKLEKLLKVYLCPVLLKLASTHTQCVQKVVSICAMLNSRLTFDKYGLLPVEALSMQYADCSVSPDVKTMTLVYILKGVAQHSLTKPDEVLARVMTGYSAAAVQQQVTAFQIICAIFQAASSKPLEELADVDKRFSAVSLDDQIVLANHFADLMLLNLGYFTTTSSFNQVGTNSAGLTTRGSSSRAVPDGASSLQSGRSERLMAGLTPQKIKFLTPQGRDTYNVTTLNEVKAGLLRFLWSPTFNVSLRYVTALIGSIDLKVEVQQVAADIIRRRCSVDLDDPLLVSLLYNHLLSREYLPSTLTCKIYAILSSSMYAITQMEAAITAITKGIKDSGAKVRSAAVGFALWFARFAVLSEDSTRLVLQSLTGHLDRTDESGTKDTHFAYETIGVLLQRNKEFLHNNIDALMYLFSAFDRETPESRTSIEQALSGLSTSFSQASAQTLDRLRSLLLNTISDKSNKLHRIVLKITLNAFQFSDSGARWICILATGREYEPEVRSVALQGLDLFQFGLMSAIHQTKSARNTFPGTEDFTSWVRANVRSITTTKMSAELDDFSTDSFLSFVRQSLYWDILNDHLGSGVLTDILWHRHLEETIRQDPQARNLLRASLSQRNILPISLAEIEDLALATICQSESPLAGRFLYELVSFNTVTQHDRTHVLTRLRGKDWRSMESANLAGMVYSTVLSNIETSADHVEHEFKYLLQAATDSEGEATKVQWLSLSCKLCAIRQRKHCIPSDVLLSLNKWLSVYLADNSVTVVKVGLELLQNLASIDMLSSPTSYVDQVMRLTLEDNTKESALVALGCLSLSSTCSLQDLEHILDSLLPAKLSESAGVYLARGLALSYLLGRWDSRPFLNSVYIRPEVPSKKNINDLNAQERIIKRLTVDYVSSANSSRASRQASSGILLILLQSLSSESFHSNELVRIQKVFLGMLAESNEIIVETANKGIVLCHQHTSGIGRDELLLALRSTFILDKSREGVPPAISTDVVNAPNDIAPAGDGNGDLAVYTDLCILAQESGKNELIYNFLAIASSTMTNTIGNGVDSVSLLNPAISHIDSSLRSPAMLERVVGKLFRNRHDPNTKARAVMQRIFTDLFPDLSSTLKTYSNIVLNDLMNALNSRAWRVRQAATSALTELINVDASLHLRIPVDQLWTPAFRTLDDIKDSVREAGLKFCKTLGRVLMKAVERVSSSDAPLIPDSSLPTVIPLLQTNLKSPSPDIASFALNLLLNIVRSANRSNIQLFLPYLIQDFLLLSSSLEPEMLNYLSFHASKYDLTQAQLDEARIASIRNSPLIAALDSCIDLLNEDSIGGVVTNISNILRQTHGLPTRIATSRLIIYMVTTRATAVLPYADALIQAISGTFRDPNLTVVRANVSAIGYLARLATTEKLIRLNTFLSKKYFTRLPEDYKDLGMTLQAISQYAPDRLMSLAKEYLPLVFIGRCDPDESVKATYETIWSTHTGNLSSIRLYQAETLKLIIDHLASPAWQIRQMCSSALSLLVMHGNTDDSIDDLLEIEVHNLKGRLWPGKEALVSALVVTAQKASGQSLRMDSSTITASIVREAQRTDPKYKKLILPLLKSYLENADISVFDQVKDIVEATYHGKGLDMDEIDEKIRVPLKLTLVEECIGCIAAAYRPTSDDKDGVSNIMYIVHSYTALASQYPWNIKAAICSSMKVVLEKIKLSQTTGFHDSEVESTWALLRGLCIDTNYQSVRESAVRTSGVFLEVCRRKSTQGTMQVIQQDLVRMLNAETSPVVSGMIRELLSSENDHINLGLSRAQHAK